MKRKRLRAEPFDIFQYLLGKTSHEPLIRCLLEFSGHIDTAALKSAVALSFEAVPQIASAFNASRYPRWDPKPFSPEDFLKTADVAFDDTDSIMNLLASSIDIAHEPQLKIFHIPGDSGDKLCIIMNHMICDGAGFKDYLYMLSDLYTQFADGQTTPKIPKRFPRSIRQLFGASFKLKVFFSKLNLPKFQGQASLSFEGDKNNPFFAVYTIEKERINSIKSYAKIRGATLNDMLLTAYARMFFRETKADEIMLPCPVDLRKYMPDKDIPVICNLTSTYPCLVTHSHSDLFDDTLAQIATQMKAHKESLASMKSSFTWELVARILPLPSLERLFPRLYTAPVTSYTNLGIIDDKRLRFAGADVEAAFLTSAVKHKPFFQLTVATYRNTLLMSSNLYGTAGDKELIERFLRDIAQELRDVTAQHR